MRSSPLEEPGQNLCNMVTISQRIMVFMKQLIRARKQYVPHPKSTLFLKEEAGTNYTQYYSIETSLVTHFFKCHLLDKCMS